MKEKASRLTTAPEHDGSGVRSAIPSHASDKTNILARLRRMEGQVRGVQKMVEEDHPCLDILTQISAIMAAARAAGLLVLEEHIRGCVMGSCQHGHLEQEEVLTELTAAIERFSRSIA
jgi:DNA-binding FrmR family transcriptional regulator